MNLMDLILTITIIGAVIAALMAYLISKVNFIEEKTAELQSRLERLDLQETDQK